MGWGCAIFDLDGTLLDTLDDLADSLNFALAEHALPARSREQTRDSVGNGVRRLIERSVPEGTPEAVLESVLSCYRARYAEHCEDATGPYPGIVEALDEIRRAGISCAVVSNKPDAQVARLTDFWFPQMGGHALGERADVERKPAAEPMLLMLDELGASPSDAVYVGDSEVDIEFARNAGIPCISCTWGFRDEETLRAAGAAIFARSPQELPSLIIG